MLNNKMADKLPTQVFNSCTLLIQPISLHDPKSIISNIKQTSITINDFLLLEKTITKEETDQQSSGAV